MAVNDSLSKTSLLTDPVRNFKFVVSFTPQKDDSKWGDTFGKLGFVSVSGLSISTETIGYREGGYNTNLQQIPGQTSFTPITLSKGVMLGNDVHARWMRRLFAVMTPLSTSGVGADFRCDVDIAVLSHPNPAAYDGSAGTTPVGSVYDQHASMRFRINNAWISSLSYGNLEAGGSTLMVEDMTLVHEGFEVTFGKNYTKAGSAQKLADDTSKID